MTRFMHLILCLVLAVALAACGAQPAPLMMGGARHETNIEGRDYVLYKKGNQVEVIRLGWADPGEHRRIRATMIELVPWLTGCDVVPSTVQGDSGEMRARVTCPKGRR